MTWPAPPPEPAPGPPPGPDPFGAPSVTPPVMPPEAPPPVHPDRAMPAEPLRDPSAEPFGTPSVLPGPAEAWRPRPYPQLLRGPRFRWWRPLASLGIVVLTIVVTLGLVIAGGFVYYLLSGAPSESSAEADATSFDASPGGMLLTNLVLAALIPVAMLAVWAGFGWRPRWLASVVGGLRWRFLGLTIGISAICVVPSLIVTVATEDISSWTPEPRWPALALVVLLTTPLQAAGEEYLFRGWIPLTIGSTLRDPRVGALLGGLVASTLFAMAHGQQDPWLFADRFAFGAVACWLVWRTGGLEAGIALHAVNNLAVFALTIADGSLRDAVTVTEASPASVLIDVGTLVVTAAVIDVVARRRGVVRLFTPPAPAVPAAA